MNTIFTSFRGFNIQLKDPVTSDRYSGIKNLLLPKIKNVLSDDSLQIEIDFPEFAPEEVVPLSEELVNTTDLVEIAIASRDDVSIAEVWNWIYQISEFTEVAYVEPRVALLDTVGTKDTLSENTQFPPDTDNPTWQLKQTEVQQAWDDFFPTSKPGHGVKIALPDTGYLFHPALEGVLFDRIGTGGQTTQSSPFRFLVRNQYDFVNKNNVNPGKGWEPDDDPDPDKFGHGVSVAGLIFAHSENKNVPPGTAPDAEPLFLRIVRSDRQANALEIFAPPLGKAIYYAINNNTHIICISLGGYPTLPVRRAILKAQSKGIIVIASAGNNVPFTVWPGAYRQVVAVASSTIEGSIAKHSARGSRINIAAPGEYVWCAVSQDFDKHSFARRSGTSFATPIVAGIAALWLSRWGVDYLFNEKYKNRPEVIPIVFNKLLRETCSTPDGWDRNAWGAGIVNASKLLAAELPNIADLTVQELDVIGGDDYPDLDQGGIRTFNHLFEHTLPNQEMVEAVLAKLTGKSSEDLPGFLQKFGRELMFHFGINKSLYKSLEDILSQVRQEVDLVTTSVANSLDKVRAKLKHNASDALKKALG